MNVGIRDGGKSFAIGRSLRLPESTSCQLSDAQKHATISRDNTAGESARKADLFAYFGKRQTLCLQILAQKSVRPDFRSSDEHPTDGRLTTEPQSPRSEPPQPSLTDSGDGSNSDLSRKGLDKKFECSHDDCRKSYSRAEHL
jgi:hypothetical protein